MRLGRCIVPVFLLAFVVFAGGRQAHAETIADYMVMKVCETNGAVDPSAAPGEKACTHMRPIRAGEVPPYFLTNFTRRSAHCPDGVGPVGKINVPVERDGVTRIVSLYSHRTGMAGCGADHDSGKIGASIEWHDDSYGFIMGSWSPVGLSNFISPLCRTAGGNSHRFYRGWVIGGTDVSAAASAVFDTKLAVGAAADAVDCPARFHPGYTAWRAARFRFSSGLTTTAIVSDHYANAALDRSGPGNAQQLERTYWTKEFGLTRWEKWAREDWTHPRSGLGAKDLSAKLSEGGTCSVPWSGVGGESAGLTREAPPGGGLPTEIHVDPRTQQRYAWHMTLCDDYSHVVHKSGQDLLTQASAASNAEFWH